MSPPRYVFLGPEGTFAEQALNLFLAQDKADGGPRAGRDLAGGRGQTHPARSVGEALDEVRAGAADAAVVPLESSVGGAVGVTLDELLAGAPLMITREIVVGVSFVLAAPGQASPATLVSIGAHPQAAIQCRGWLRRCAPAATVVELLSNAAAAAAAARGEVGAAICTQVAAQRHGLVIVASEIGDNPQAVTRFAVVTRPGAPAPPSGDDITSLVVSIAHDRVGALLSVLTELAVRGVNLTRIESRPTGGQLGRYAFFLDCTGHVAQAAMGEALQGLHRVCAQVRFLGSYPRAGVEVMTASKSATGPAPGPDAEFAGAAAWLARIRAGELSSD